MLAKLDLVTKQLETSLRDLDERITRLESDPWPGASPAAAALTKRHDDKNDVCPHCGRKK